MRAIVTGGAGFIGSHLCERLIEGGYSVTVVDNLLTGSLANLPGFERDNFVLGDVTNEKMALCFDALKPSIIYHLACAASPPAYQTDPEHTLMTCVAGTRNYLRLAERTGAKFVLASTSEVYGDPDQSPQREDYRGLVSCTGPRACYDEGKRAAETLASDFARAKRCDVRIARIFNTYGPRLKPDDGRVVSNFIRQALAGEPLTIYGAGSQTRSLCYVSDTVGGLIALGESEWFVNGPVNLGNPDERTVNEIAHLVYRATGIEGGAVTFRPLPQDDPRRRCPDIRRAKTLLGWAPKVPLEEGLAQTVGWFRANLPKEAANG